MTSSLGRFCAMEMKLELVAVPVSDVDRAKAFYAQAGVRRRPRPRRERRRAVRAADPARVGLLDRDRRPVSTRWRPGSLDNLQCVVADADAVRAELRRCGVGASEVDRQAWGRFVRRGPDGDAWSFQQLPDWSAGAGGDGSSQQD